MELAVIVPILGNKKVNYKAKRGYLLLQKIFYKTLARLKQGRPPCIFNTGRHTVILFPQTFGNS